MTIRKTFALSAAVAALTFGVGLAAPTGATAGETRIIVSDTWKAGFTKGDDGSYVKIVREDRVRDSGQVAHLHERDTWAPGYSNTGEGQYERLVLDDHGGPNESVARLETRDTWAPGYVNSDMGDYERLVIERPSAPAGGSVAELPATGTVSR